ncbi:MAG: glycosyltransferase [Planctomycetes bacterium]|nr:glycosyltransferase [Planctomycetota bacterium]MBI3843047.1 glycosyltransferase [Planctomycetota bacterium]
MSNVESDTDPRISVVVPNFNGMATIRACIESIQENAGYDDWELVVVDGGSTDGSLEYLNSLPSIRVIEEPLRGVAVALNTAIARTGRNDVVRIHADVAIETPGFLRLLADAARTAPKAGVVGVKLVYPDDRIQSVGRNLVTGIGANDRHANLRCFQPDDGKAGGSPMEVDCAPGAVAYYRRETIDATGGLDESYWPCWGDDDDFCMMARCRGFKVYVHTGVRAVHHSGKWSPISHQWIWDRGEVAYKAPLLKQATMEAHWDYWQKKWGWHPRFPDVSEIRRLYGDTEICWQIGERMRFQPTSWPPSVDVVMVTWNNLKTLQRTFEHLARTQYPSLEVHVADNSSTDGTLAYLDELKARFPFPLHVRRLPVNTGVAVGFNSAIVAGHGELVARLDDDVVVPPDWLAKLVDRFRQRPFAGCVGPKILNDNANRDIQCGPYRLYPSLYGHDGEPDAGQADYLARAVHVRGCCNVYRRDVLDRCGLFDLRFSPSQFDDPDHHAALGVAGWEILYDGTVGVVHALNSGTGKTFAALSNQAANQQKLFGKWGEDIWMLLDRAIDLSREGRYLPNDGDTSAFLERLPPPGSFPCLGGLTLSDVDRAKRLKATTYREAGRRGDTNLGNIWDEYRELAASKRRDGFPAQAADVLHAALDLAPWRADLLADLALTYERLGQPERAHKLLRRAVRLTPDDAALRARLTAASAAPRAAGRAGTPADRSGEIGESTLIRAAATGRSHLRVLIVNTFEPRAAGGDMHQLKKTQQHLEALGVHVDVCYTPRPDPRGYDLVHVYNLWFPQQTLPQVKAIRVAAPDVPIVMTPIYWDMTEKAWADHAVPYVFVSSLNEPDLDAKLARLPDPTVKVNGWARSQRHEPNFHGYEEYQREILGFVDWLLPQSELEMKNLESTLGVTKPYTLVTNAAEPGIFEAATPDAFVRAHGVRDFVVTVGLVEQRKNQLMLLYALRRTGLPVVVIGRNYDRNYLRLCREFAPPKTLFIEHLPHDMLASALKAARVFALPSWMECASFASIEAALAGCSMVVSNRTSEPEYFGNDAYLCDPANVVSIRDAVVHAYRNYAEDAPKRDRLRTTFTTERTWPRAAEQTLQAYRMALALRSGQHARELDGDPTLPAMA